MTELAFLAWLMLSGFLGFRDGLVWYDGDRFAVDNQWVGIRTGFHPDEEPGRGLFGRG